MSLNKSLTPLNRRSPFKTWAVLLGMAALACSSTRAPDPSTNGGRIYSVPATPTSKSQITSVPCSNLPFRNDVEIEQQPSPETLLVPPTPPAKVRGSQAVVQIIIDSTGRVLPDSVWICGVSDRAYSAKLAAVMAGASFRPARGEGRPVRSVLSLSFTF
jgi:hypothetical protein